MSIELTEQEARYLMDLRRYYEQVISHPQQSLAKHPKASAYGLSLSRARELIAEENPSCEIVRRLLPYSSRASYESKPLF